MPRTRTVFVLGVLAGAAVVLAMAALNRPQSRASLDARKLTSDVWVSEQISADDFRALQSKHVRSIIDLRPDGEAPDQPDSSRVREWAAQRGIAFAYVPVPHGEIPPQSVDALSAALASAQKPALLYCRSGKRAARTWALVEASRAEGMDAAAIAAAVAAVGQNVDDLHDPIAARIAARSQGRP
jgi:uncharacterized protein (TIGR01244 family)